MWRITGAQAAELFQTEKVSRLSHGVSVLTNVITGNKQVVNCIQPFHRIILLAIKIANLLSKFPFFSGFVSHTSTCALVCVTSFYRKLLLIMWSGSCSVDPWAGQLFRLTLSPSFGRRLRRAAEWRKNTLTHAYWRYLAGLFLCFHFWPLFFLSPQENTELRGCRAATSTVPPSPPHLISVVQSFETSVSRSTKEWWSMCNKCQCHGNPRFPPKIFLFIPFEDLSPGRAGITWPQAKPWQSLFSICALID